VPSLAGNGPVPAAAYNVAAQLLAAEAGVAPIRRWRASTLAASSPTERREVFSRSHALTGREEALLRHLAEGVDTRTVARSMTISQHTVQDHLKSMFSKTYTSSRTELLAKSAGR
jgi:DNA-binding CsgD family transcriptional regulator